MKTARLHSRWAAWLVLVDHVGTVPCSTRVKLVSMKTVSITAFANTSGGACSEAAEKAAEAAAMATVSSEMGIG